MEPRVTTRHTTGGLKFGVRGITIRATTSAKYWSTKINVGASSEGSDRQTAGGIPSVHPTKPQHVEVRGPQREDQKPKRFGHCSCRFCCTVVDRFMAKSFPVYISWFCDRIF